MPWVGLQCVIVVFPDHTHFLNKVSLTKPTIKSGSVLATFSKFLKVYDSKDKMECDSCPLSILKWVYL